MSIWAMHHDAALWHHAEDFLPERWIDSLPEAKQRPVHAYAPFGDGPRKCVAFRFALEEAKIAIIRMYQQFTFSLSPGQIPLKVRNGITMSPKNGLHVAVHARTASTKA